SSSACPARRWPRCRACRPSRPRSWSWASAGASRSWAGVPAAPERSLHPERILQRAQPADEIAREGREQHRHTDHGGEPDGDANHRLAFHAASLAAMSLAGRAARIGLGVAGAFIGYAWLPHLFTGTATWRGHVTLAELTGVAPRHFRPPWGMVNAAMGRALTRTGERCVFWSLQPEGLRPRSAEAQAEYVVTRVSPGAIVDLHDAEGVAGAPARLVAAPGTMLNGLRDAGYRLTTVAELLGDARAARGRGWSASRDE